MGSLPNLHELGRADMGLSHYRPGPALGHHCGNGQSILTPEEKSKILHRHSGHGKITKARSNGNGSKIIYDEFMLEQMAAYSPISSRSTRNLHTLRRRDSMNSSIGATSVRRLITVVRNTSSRSGPVYTRRVLMRNLIMLCISHLLMTAAFLPFLALQSSVSVWSLPALSAAVPIGMNSGALLLAVMHLFAAASSLVSAALIQKLGTNWVFLVSYAVFAVFFAVHAFPNVYLLAPAYVLLGLVLGPVSLAKVSFLMTISTKLSYSFSEEDEDSKISRRTCIIRRVARAFKASHDFGFIIGSVLTAFIITFTINHENAATLALTNKTSLIKTADTIDSYPSCPQANCTASNCPPTKTCTPESPVYEYVAYVDDIFDLDSSGERICGSHACPHAYVPSTNDSDGHVYFRVLPKTTTTMLAGVYVSLAMLALFVAAAGFDRIRMFVYQDPLERPEGLAALRAVRESFRDVRLQLVAPMAVFIGLEQAFMYADFSKSYVVCTLGIHRLNYVFLCMGLLQSVAACTLSMLLRTIRRYYVIGVGFTFHACLLMVQMVWKPMEDDPALFFVISAAWGVCNAIWEISNFTLLTGLYADNWEAAFANSFFFRYMGLAAVFLFHGFVCNYVKLYFLAFFMLVATVPFTWLEVKLENMRKVKVISRL